MLSRRNFPAWHQIFQKCKATPAACPGVLYWFLVLLVSFDIAL